jgi:hypothetical protein
LALVISRVEKQGRRQVSNTDRIMSWIIPPNRFRSDCENSRVVDICAVFPGQVGNDSVLRFHLVHRELEKLRNLECRDRVPVRMGRQFAPGEISPESFRGRDRLPERGDLRSSRPDRTLATLFSNSNSLFSKRESTGKVVESGWTR